MKKKQPQTIADLKINLTFEKQYFRYEIFITNFIFANQGLKNYEIKPDNYIFEIKINDKIINFDIFVLKNDCLYDNRLNDLMFQLYTEISTYLFDNEIRDVLSLIKFQTKDSKTFTIICEVVPF